jgi:hypothetical protein
MMWNPIIDGELRTEVFETIELIAAAIKKAAGPGVPEPVTKSSKAGRKLQSRSDSVVFSSDQAYSVANQCAKDISVGLSRLCLYR